MNFINKFLKGLAMGASAVAPGVSGGALAAVFGLYDKIIHFIANITKNLKENIIFFLPIALGGAAGVLVFSRIIEYLYKYHEVGVRYAFTGLMLGTIPSVIRTANMKGYKKIYLFPFFACLLLTIAITVLENNQGIASVGTAPLNIIMYGSIIGFGTIIPGISASLILMYIGAYEIVIAAISNLHIYTVFYLGIGFSVSVILFAKVISMLFERVYGFTYYAIVGFVIGSILSIFPGFEPNLSYSLNLILLIACFTLSYSLSKLSTNKKE
ncbi:MAG: DUF368 domain-containing protein [Tissierellia bacterium]|nr:DUF368 domain-containing protein [Tissierellia bacterium]